MYLIYLQDDEFEGFTKEDVRQAEKKLQKVLAEEAKSDITSPGMTKAFNQLSINKASSMNFYIRFEHSSE